MTERLRTRSDAVQALEGIGRPAAIEEFYSKSVGVRLFAFDTSSPEHVLRTTIRRQRPMSSGSTPLTRRCFI